MQKCDKCGKPLLGKKVITDDDQVLCISCAEEERVSGVEVDISEDVTKPFTSSSRNDAADSVESKYGLLKFLSGVFGVFGVIGIILGFILLMDGCGSHGRMSDMTVMYGIVLLSSGIGSIVASLLVHLFVDVEYDIRLLIAEVKGIKK